LCECNVQLSDGEVLMP